MSVPLLYTIGSDVQDAEPCIVNVHGKYILNRRRSFGQGTQSMFKVTQFKQEVLTPILEKFSNDQSLANAYCVIWAIDAYATHMALGQDGSPDNAFRLEKAFKAKVATKFWQFRVIREASNATKHAIRKVGAKDVSKSSDVKPDDGVGFYAYFSNVDGGVTIDTDWEYRASENAFFDAAGEKVEGYSGIGPTIYLSKIIDDTIEAIEGEGIHPET
jgi:hypothetical protein